MLLHSERELIVEFSNRMLDDGLTVSTSGNISIRFEDLIAITPAGVDYRRLAPESICIIDLEGNLVDGKLEPSSEVPMHTIVYREMDAGAVVHNHPPFATTISTVMEELPAVHYMIALLGGPIAVAPYATYGTRELAENIVKAMAGRSAVLLQNHGATTVGETLDDAYTKSIYLEWICRLCYQAHLLGKPKILSEREIGRVAEKLRLRPRHP
jgi:L-fuculose-phosphate aldolase